MKLLTAELRKSLPPLYSQEHVADPMIRVKFFDPCGSATWYGLEFDGNDTFFGYVTGFGSDELGYFSLSELEAIRGPLGIGIERDLYFTPVPLSSVKGG